MKSRKLLKQGWSPVDFTLDQFSPVRTWALETLQPNTFAFSRIMVDHRPHIRVMFLNSSDAVFAKLKYN